MGLREFVFSEFARAGLPSPEMGETYARLLPGLRPQAFADNTVAGPNWALIGDASGSVDPLTGEGIYYAIKTAHLLAEALIEGNLLGYEPAWKAMAAASIAKVSKKRDVFYHPATLRMLGLLLDYSPSIRTLACDVICGSQKYDTLQASGQGGDSPLISKKPSPTSSSLAKGGCDLDSLIRPAVSRYHLSFDNPLHPWIVQHP